MHDMVLAGMQRMHHAVIEQVDTEYQIGAPCPTRGATAIKLTHAVLSEQFLSWCRAPNDEQ